MTAKWLPTDQWKFIQGVIPIPCLDILPAKVSPVDHSCLSAVGLIRRNTPDQGPKWCLIGGRILYEERLCDGVLRQVHEALGSNVRAHFLSEDMQPIYIAQYFPFGGRDDCRDPRQHSLGMTYLVQLEGSIEPQGEALDFNWFSIARLPNEDEFGFNQDIVIKECIKIFAKR